MKIDPASRILFQGDSITDCQRNRDLFDDLGRGYVNMTAGFLNARYPELGAECLNRGISGNRTGDLLARWEEDCLLLEPDVLSLLIGINDVWRRYDRDLPTSAETFADNYRQLLRSTRERLPEVRILLLEPFLLPVPEDRRRWREDLDPKLAVVRDLAREFEADLIPLDGLFATASTRQPCAFWAHDGVHPSPAGHGLIAQAWLDAVSV